MSLFDLSQMGVMPGLTSQMMGRPQMQTMSPEMMLRMGMNPQFQPPAGFGMGTGAGQSSSIPTYGHIMPQFQPNASMPATNNAAAIARLLRRPAQLQGSGDCASPLGCGDWGGGG